MRPLVLAVAVLLAHVIGAQDVRASDARSAKIVAAEVDEALRASGYRLRAVVSREGETPQASLKITLLGQREEGRQRLMVQAVAPDAVRGQAVLMEIGAGGVLRTTGRDAKGGRGMRPANPFDPVFGSDLVPWDFLSLWWRWPHQDKVRAETVMDYECEVIESSGSGGPVVRVRSWVAAALRIPLRVEFYAADGTRLRTMRVLRLARRTNGGTAARVVSLEAAGKPASRFEVYNGEEGLVLGPAAFSPARVLEPAESEGPK